MKMQKATAVLSLTLDGGMLTAVEVKRSNGSVRLVKHLKAPITLDPLRDEPELVGREIRNLLDQAKIATKRSDQNCFCLAYVLVSLFVLTEKDTI